MESEKLTDNDNKNVENSSVESGNVSLNNGVSGSLVNGGEKGDHEGDPDEGLDRKKVGVAQDEVSGSGDVVDSSGVAVARAEVGEKGVGGGGIEVGSGEVEGSYDGQKVVPGVRVLDEAVEEEEEEEWGDAVEGPKGETPKGGEGEAGGVELGEVGSGDGKVEENTDGVAAASEGNYVKGSTYADVVVSGSAPAGNREDKGELEVRGGNEESLENETAAADSDAAAVEVKFTDKGDAVVESINVDPVEAVRSGTAVVEVPKVKTPEEGEGEREKEPHVESLKADDDGEEGAKVGAPKGDGPGVEEKTVESLEVGSHAVEARDMEDKGELEVRGGNEESVENETAAADPDVAIDGVKFTDTGDAVVDSINVDAVEAVRSGTAVVEVPKVKTPEEGEGEKEKEPHVESKADDDGEEGAKVGALKGDEPELEDKAVESSEVGSHAVEAGDMEDKGKLEVRGGNEESVEHETAAADSDAATVGVKFTNMGDAVVDSIIVDAVEAVRSGTAVVEAPKVKTPEEGEGEKEKELHVESLKADDDGEDGAKLVAPKGNETDVEEKAVESSEVGSHAVEVEENGALSASASEGNYVKGSTYADVVVSGVADAAENRELTKESVDGVKFTDDGDAVVDCINVDAAEAVRSGTAVVGELEEMKGIERSGTAVVENAAQVVKNTVADNSALKDSKLIETGEVKSIGEDSVVDSISVNVVEAVRSGVVAVGDSEVEGKEPKVNGTPDHGSENVTLANDFEPLVPTSSSEIDSVGGEQQTENQMNEADAPQPVESVEQQNTEETKLKADSQSKQQDPTSELQPVSAGGVKDRSYANVLLGGTHAATSDKKHQHELVEQTDIPSPEIGADADIEMLGTEKLDEGSGINEEGKLVNFGSGSSSNKIIEELKSHDHSEIIDGEAITESEDEGESGDEGEGPELFDSAALTALLKAATGAGSDPGNITMTSQDGSRLFSIERPAGLGPSLRSVRSASGPSNSSFITPLGAAPLSEEDLSEEEKDKLQNLYQLKVKFLRLVQRAGFTAENSLASQVLYKLSLYGGRRSALPAFSVENAKQAAMQLESEGKDVLNLSLNILVLGKTGVGKSAIINSMFLEEKVKINAFKPETTSVTEICGTVDGVNIRFIDVPGLKTAALEQGYNRKVLDSVKKFTKKYPIDVMFYVDRLDSQTRDLNDLPMLRTITASLGSSIWRNTIITLTHASSAPPDGPSGTPLSYEVFVAQRSHIVQQSIGQAVGDLRLMNLNMMSPISLVENHPACRKNREGQKVLPNGQAWRPQLLVVCYSMKILSEASSTAKPQDPIIDSRKLFGFRVRSPPLPYLLSSLLQPRVHPKLPADQGGDNIDSDIDLDDLSDSDQDEEVDEYDQLPPFKPLRKSQITKLSNEQKKAYFEEYDYRVKLLQKKQWKEELKRMKQMKKAKSGVGAIAEMREDYDGNGDGESGAPASVAVPLPDMILPPSFDGDNPAYRYRFLEPTSQFLARPVLDTHGWDHDCGYDGVNVEQNLGIAGRFPVAVTAQVTKDKKDFNVHLDSAVAAKHGENGSSLVGFDIQSIGKQYAYIIKGESKFKNLKKNKTTAGVSVTFLGENVASGVKLEDQITLGKRLVLVGSTGTVRSQKDAAYGANVEVRLRDADYPVGQEQSSFTLSLMKWRGDLAIGGNLQSQVSIGRNSKMALRVALNNKQSGQITVKTSSSDHISLALAGLVPIALSIYQKLKPGVSENYSIY